jgi:fatty-acyl-CoA synthase
MARVTDWIDAHARRTPGAIAWVEEGSSTSWAALAEEVERAAGALDLLGVGPGARVALRAPNSRDHLVLLAACGRLGAIAAFVNTRSAPDEVDALLDLVGPRVLVTHDGVGARAPHVLTPEAWRARVAGARPAHGQPSRAADLDATALILFTSGSTGRPRGAALSHRNLEASARQFVDGLGLRADDVNLAVAPLFHAAGLGCFTLPLVMLGGRNVSAPRFDAAACARALPEVTCAFMVPAMWRDAARAAPDGWRGRLRVGLSGGAPLPPATRDLVAARLGVDLHVGYGMTETAPSATLASPDAVAARPGYVGRPARGVACRVTGPDGERLPAGEIGRVELRGPNVMRGYWADEDATREVLTGDGWLRTGDLGALDAGGGLTLSGRLAHMIITGGENVYPAEVERALTRIDGVDEAAVFATPHARWGQAVTAAVVCDDGWDLERLRSRLGGLARYKHPTRWVRVEALPRGGSGKVLRAELSGLWRARGGREDADDRAGAVGGADDGGRGEGGARRGARHAG